MSPRFKSGLVLAAVFLLGALTGGGLATAKNARKLGRLYDAPPIALRQRFILNSLEREVRLDQEQERRIESIVAAYQGEQQALRREVDPRMVASRARLLDELRALMRPDQLADYERFVRKVEARTRRRGP